MTELLKGLHAVVAEVENKARLIQGKTAQGMAEAALLVKFDAVRMTPMRYGNLRDSAYALVKNIGFVYGKRGRPSVPNKGPHGKTLFQHHKDALASRLARTRVSSKFLKANQIGGDLWFEVGYTMPYALWVHELNRNYDYGEWKFLEKSFRKNKREIFNILKRSAKFK